MEETKIRIWEQLAYSITKPSKYLEMSGIRTGKSVKFIIVLMLLVTMMLNIIPTAATIIGFGGWKRLFTNMPSISVQNETLSTESKIDLGLGVIHFYIDNDADTVSYSELQDETYYILIGKNTVRYVFVDGDNGVVLASGHVSELIPNGFSNQTLIDMIPVIYLIILLGFIFCFLAYFVKYAFLSIVYSILVTPVNRAYNLGLSYGRIFMICFYAQTLGILLVNINTALGTIIPSFIMSIIGIFITMRYISIGVMSHIKDKGNDGLM